MTRISSVELSWSRAVVLVAVLAGCGGSTSHGSGAGALPLIKPPVVAATPAGLKSSGTSLRRALVTADVASSLDPADIQGRFFSAGPTDLFGILDAIDARIGDINTQADGSTSPCLTQTPVAYDVTPWGQTVTFYAQCYETVTVSGATTPQFVQWGQKDGVTYLYTAVGAEHVAVIATPITGSDTYRIQAWIGLGYSNSACGPGTWDGCSYGVMQLLADPSTGELELAVAGVGFGYCGAQIKTDGTNVYGMGSTDMGTTCNAAASLCVSASDLATPGTCDAITSFTVPAIGRKSVTGSDVEPINGGVFADSAYPDSGANVTVDGTGTDDLAFGPSAPTDGVGAF
jgi:hypothetical protein